MLLCRVLFTILQSITKVLLIRTPKQPIETRTVNLVKEMIYEMLSVPALRSYYILWRKQLRRGAT